MLIKNFTNAHDFVSGLVSAIPKFFQILRRALTKLCTVNTKLKIEVQNTKKGPPISFFNPLLQKLKIISIK